MGEGLLSAAGTIPGAAGGEDGTLCCEEVSLQSLAAAVGTPFYVYSARTVRERYSRLDASLAGIPHRLHYACKANGHVAILGLLRAEGAAIDVVSGGELFRALRAGFGAADVIFGGVGKTAEEIEYALRAGVGMVSAESGDEVRLVDELARRLGVVARVGIRVNPEITVETFHDYIKTGEKGDKFGVPMDSADEVARLAARLPNTRLVGIGMHIGSQLVDVGAYGVGLARLESLIAGLVGEGIATIEHLDAGGGLFVPYDDEGEVDLSAFAGVMAPVVARLGLRLIVEPGRYIVAEAGALVTTVLYRKRSGGRDILVTDAGMNDLLRPSHYDAFHRIEAVVPTGARGRFDVVGPICESGDFYAIDREMDDVGPGALLCVHTTGAYGYCMASNYNARPRAAEVLVDGRRWAVVTMRETFDDLVRRETAAPEWRET